MTTATETQPPANAKADSSLRCAVSTDSAPSPEDIAMGMNWWNGLTRTERLTVLNEADRVRGWDGRDLTKASAPADAWALWKSGKIRMDGAVPNNAMSHERSELAP